MTEIKEITMRGDNGCRIQLVVSPPDTEKWCATKVKAQLGGFKANFDASLFLPFDLSFSDPRKQKNDNLLLDELKNLYETLVGEVEMETLESQIFLKFKGNSMGKIAVSGFLMDAAGIGQKLVFEFDSDQTMLAEFIKDVEAVIGWL